MAETTPYREPLALVILSTISIGLAAIAALWILIDIILRRGWRSMMLIMIPVYVVNALYLWPITLWTYLRYGRPPKPTKGEAAAPSCAHHAGKASSGQAPSDSSEEKGDTNPEHARHDHDEADPQETANSGGHAAHHHHGGGERPMFATITVAVCHCGAGCVLGDVIGEWLVYGTGATIAGRELWVNYLVDFAFAIAFGIFFQYYSIAPMTGDYGLKTLYRAAKADFLSLVFFEVGLFAWMAIFQIAIFRWRLPMDTVTYWWMMQIGMFLGHWTGVPINWWLIKTGVKEPCA